MWALSDFWGGALALIGVIGAAMMGYLGTRGSTNASFAADLISELRADNAEMRERLDKLTAENAELQEHVRRCDMDNAEAAKRIQALEAIIRQAYGRQNIADVLDDVLNHDDD